jgi:hypothetical protein
MMVRAIAIGLVCGCTSLSAPLQADQRNALPRIGVLALAIPALEDGLRDRLAEVGYVDRKTATVEWRRADGAQEQIRSMAAELIHLRVNALNQNP